MPLLDILLAIFGFGLMVLCMLFPEKVKSFYSTNNEKEIKPQLKKITIGLFVLIIDFGIWSICSLVVGINITDEGKILFNFITIIIVPLISFIFIFFGLIDLIKHLLSTKKTKQKEARNKPGVTS